MEIKPKRSLSLNSELANNYFDITSQFGISNRMWTRHDLKRMNPTSSSSSSTGCRMNHSLSMEDARINHQNLENKKQEDSSFLRGMHWVLGSLTNMVSKIPSFVTSINNPLSVTVVADQSIIFAPELKENMKIISEGSSYPNAGIYTDGNLLASNWMDDLQLSESQESNDLSRAIQESLEQMKTQKNLHFHGKLETNVDKIDFIPNTSDKFKDNNQNTMENLKDYSEKDQCQEIIENNEEKLVDRGSASPCHAVKIQVNNLKNLRKSKHPLRKMKKTVGKSVASSSLTSTNSKTIPTKMDAIEFENPANRPHVLKTRKRTCGLVCGRRKLRPKFQLRKSPSSQLKHHKEKLRQNLYSNIQDDLDSWEMEDDEPEKEVPLDGETDEMPGCSSSNDSDVVDESTAGQRKRTISNDSSPDILLSVPVGSRPRMLSESSVDSQDSCSIVFEDGDSCSVSSFDSDDNDDDDDDDDEDGEETSSEEEEDEEEEGTNEREESMPKVRFNLEPTIHTMIKWNYAYRAARKGPWEEMARDRDRFRGRVHRTGQILNPILTAEHRESIWHNRFANDESANVMEEVENSME